MFAKSLKLAAAATLAVGVVASGIAPVTAAPASVPSADYPPKVKAATPKPNVGSGKKAVWVKVRPKVNKKFSIRVQIKKKGKWVVTRFLYRTDKKKQKVKIPVKPGKYRFRVVSRKVGNDLYIGATSKVVKVKK